jgi:hypothetical protein
LQAVQTCVRELARKHPWLVDAIRTAFDDFQILHDRFMAEKAAMRDKERRLAREQLAKGWLCDPEAGDNNSCLFVRVEGLCPVALADRLGKHGEASLPKALERKSAAAALAALDRDSIYQAVDLPEGKRDEMAAEYRAALDAKTHVEHRWRVTLRKPLDWREPADPHSLDRADLTRFTEPDLMTIALYRLGGLADVGELQPIVPEPVSTGNIAKDTRAHAAWRSRFPISDHTRNQDEPALSERAFPPSTAERMLSLVERWVLDDENTRNSASTTEHPALVLFHALNELHTLCCSSGAFRDLAEQRTRAREQCLNFLKHRAKIDSDQANKLGEAGAPREQAWALSTEGKDRASDPSPSNEPEAYTRSLRKNILDPGRTWCQRARAALQAGGAKGLDSATPPNAAGQPRSIELHTKLQAAEGVFFGLTIGLGDPRIIIDKDAAIMADLGKFFARTRDELRAVFETRGLDAPTPTHTLPLSPTSKAPPARTEVVLWEGAEYNERIVRLARTRSAYLEAHGKVTDALAALTLGGNAIGKSTFYDHLRALDTACPGWRASVLVSGASGIPESGVAVRTPKKSRGKVR